MSCAKRLGLSRNSYVLSFDYSINFLCTIQTAICRLPDQARHTVGSDRISIEVLKNDSDNDANDDDDTGDSGGGDDDDVNDYDGGDCA